MRLRPGRNMRNKSPSKHAVKCNLTTQLVKHDHLLRGVISETQPAVFRFESPTAHPHAGRRIVLHSGRRGEGHPQRGGHTEKTMWHGGFLLGGRPSKRKLRATSASRWCRCLRTGMSRNWCGSAGDRWMRSCCLLRARRGFSLWHRHSRTHFMDSLRCPARGKKNRTTRHGP